MNQQAYGEKDAGPQGAADQHHETDGGSGRPFRRCWRVQTAGEQILQVVNVGGDRNGFA